GYQGIRFAERLALSAGRATFRQLGHDELAEVERAAAFQCINARIHQRFDALVGRPEAPGDARGTMWIVHPFTGRRVRAASTLQP
nr:hypothetical protein [Myxococcaceae bacterium]